MSGTTYTQQMIKQQLAQRSGQVSIASSGGGYQLVDDLTGGVLSGPQASSILLANQQRVNDPKIKAQALDLARGHYQGSGVPPEMVEALATVAAYISAVKGVSVTTLISQNGVSMEVIKAYNALKPKGSQVGVVRSSNIPSWTNNPTLRGSILAAITEQP